MRHGSAWWQRGAVVVCSLAAWTWVASLAAGPQDAGVMATWRDQEIRKSYSAGSNQTEIALVLVLSCPAGSPALEFTAAFRGREPAAPPLRLRMRVAAGMRVNPNVMRSLTLRFILNPERDRPEAMDVSDRLHALLPFGAGSRVDTGHGEIDLAEFRRVLDAGMLAVEPLGLGPCPLMPAQLEVLRAFGGAILVCTEQDPCPRPPGDRRGDARPAGVGDPDTGV